MLSFDEWESKLKNWQKQSRSRVIGKNAIFLSEIDSTNKYLKEKTQLSNGTIVAAYQQTQGKGQKNRTWISNPGGLYVSIKLDMKPLKEFQPFWITASVPVGLCKAIQELELEPLIKWPNDILINNKKVSGILTETILTNDKIVAIIGLGINIDNSLENVFTTFPELQLKISSLSKELSQKSSIDITALLESTILYVEEKLLTPTSTTLHEIKQDWLNFSQIEHKTVEIEILETKKKTIGIVQKVTDSGSLLIKHPTGILEEYTSGDIKIQR